LLLGLRKETDLINQMIREWQDLNEQLCDIATPAAPNDKEGDQV